jgi:catechol 2,3-dioxygenase-like lactoylglutathione lyase family enzyme
MVAKALDHIAITVSETERSLHFYRDALGLEQVEQHQLDGAKIEKALGVAGANAQSTRMAAKGTPSILIDLMEFRTPAKEPVLAPTGAVGSTHFALAVENLSEVYRSVSGGKGSYEFVSEPVTFDLYRGLGDRCSSTRDPDGNVVELVDLQEGSWVGLQPAAASMHRDLPYPVLAARLQQRVGAACRPPVPPPTLQPWRL